MMKASPRVRDIAEGVAGSPQNGSAFGDEAAARMPFNQCVPGVVLG